MQSAQLSPIIKNNLWKFGSFECQLYFILIKKKLESSTLNFSCINVFIICTVCCNIFCIALAKRSLTRDWSALLKKISCGRTSDFFLGKQVDTRLSSDEMGVVIFIGYVFPADWELYKDNVRLFVFRKISRHIYIYIFHELYSSPVSNSGKYQDFSVFLLFLNITILH